MRTSFLLLLTFFTFSFSVVANPFQQDSVGIEEVDGKKYIIHKVADNETLYSLSRRYNVSIYQIIENNPPTEFGLEIGTLVKIPMIEKKKAEPIMEVRPIEVKTGPSSKQGQEVYHEVKSKETLFSISKMYGVSVGDLKDWNDLPGNAIDVGQRLLIKDQVVNSGSVDKSVSVKGKTHIVAQSETLYSISRKYNTTVEKLKDWNALMSNEISIGQELVVTKDSISNASTKIPSAKDSINKDNIAEVDTDTKDSTQRYRPIENPIVNASDSGFEEIVESGLAALIEGSADTRKYLALHRTAKVGTIMRVTNEMNGQEVFVRVLGKLPDTGINNNIVLRISKSAYDRLGAIDPKFRIKVSYLP